MIAPDSAGGSRAGENAGNPSAPAGECAQPVCLPRTESYLLRARESAREYRIQIALPDGPPPAAGFPVIYLLDGDAIFATVAETVRMRSRRPDVTGVVPAVVVGIGPPSGEAYDRTRRLLDYTPPTPAAKGGKGEGSHPADPAPTGGGDAFLSFIETEVKPEIERRLPIDRSRQTLVGHSLGGLLVLHALAWGRGAFRGYVAASPSVWWADRRILDDLPAAPDRLEGEPADLRVMITVGEYEQALAPHEHASPGAAEKAARRAERRMVDDAAAAAERLSALQALGGSIHFEVFPGEDHASSLLLTVHRFLRFVLAP